MNDMKIEMQCLIRDRDTARNQVVVLERAVDLGELERLKLDEKLQKSRRKCEELEETVTRLLEEQRVSNDREKSAEERSDKLFFGINELKSKNLENERLARVYQEKHKRLDTMVVRMGREIEDLRHEKLAAVKTIEELRRGNLEANETIDELRLEKLESDKVAALYKSRLENLSPRIKKIEEDLADMLAMKVGDLADLVNGARKPSTSEEGGDLDFPDDAENVVVLSTGVRSASNSTGGRSKGLSKKGAHASGTRLMSGEGCSSKIALSSSAAGDIIEIIDSDDEAKPDGAADISNKGVGSNMGENEINFVQSPTSTKRSKRNRTDCMGDLLANSTTKRKGIHAQAMRMLY